MEQKTDLDSSWNLGVCAVGQEQGPATVAMVFPLENFTLCKAPGTSEWQAVRQLEADVKTVARIRMVGESSLVLCYRRTAWSAPPAGLVLYSPGPQLAVQGAAGLTSSRIVWNIARLVLSAKAEFRCIEIKMSCCQSLTSRKAKWTRKAFLKSSSHFGFINIY